MRFSFVLKSLTPLLMSWDNIEGSDLVADWIRDPENKGLSKPGDDRTPPWAWQTRLYHDGEHVAVPLANVMKCLSQAAANVTLKGAKTYKQASQSCISIQSEYLEFRCHGKQVPVPKVQALFDLPFPEQAEGVKKLGFELFLKRAQPAGGKGKHVRVRPKFRSWSVHGEMTLIRPDLLTPEVLKTIFRLAGPCGLGDWRPTAPKGPGPYGQFEAEIKKL